MDGLAPQRGRKVRNPGHWPIPTVVIPMAKKAAKSTRRRSGGAVKAPVASAKGKNLVIVESPAKARTINRYLGDDYVVTASMGHVRDLPKRDIGVDLEHDFEPSYEVIDGRKKVVSELKRAAQGATAVFLATDLDREGEAIAWHLAETLDVPADRIRRVVFNEITKGAIQEAFQHPRHIELNRVNAQQARRILDRIVGYQISPLLWRKVSKGLSAGRVQSVAVRVIVEREREIAAFMPDEFWRIQAVLTGQLQGAPELAKAWLGFLARPDEQGNTPTKADQQTWLGEHGAFWADMTHWQGAKLDLHDLEQSRQIAEALGLVIDNVQRTEHPDAKGPAQHEVTLQTHLYEPDGTTGQAKLTITDLSERRATTRPNPPFTTATLQQAASNQLRFAASRTMRTAQQLYEGVDVPGEGSVGLITYMRTDSVNLSRDAISAVRTMIGREFGERYVPESPNFYAARSNAQEAHEAIRPTDPSRRPEDLRSSLSDEQYRLYKLIWTRFVACQMPPAEWNVTEATISAATDKGEGTFKAVGRQLAFDGFMRVTGVYSRGGDQILPPLANGQDLAALELGCTQHFTQPPARYTEATLVKALEGEGIGRPSTYASIIQTIEDRQYVEQLDRRFHPTPLGTKVTDKLVEHFPRVMDIKFTAHMEGQLDKIEEADLDWIAVLQEFYGPFRENLARATEEMQHAKAESEPSEYTCETCGQPMVYRWNTNGRYLACTGYPECKTTHPVDKQGKKVEQKIVEKACPECGGDMMVRRSRFGPFLGCTKYPECKGTLKCDKEGNPLKIVKEEDVTGECPKCGGPMAVKRKGRRPFLGCTRWPDCDGTGPIPDGIALEAPPKAPPKDAGLTCPKCGKKPMVIREGPRGEFVACSGFPRCRNSFNLDLLEEVKKAAAAGQDAQAVIDGARSAGRKTAKKAKTAKKSTKADSENEAAE